MDKGERARGYCNKAGNVTHGLNQGGSRDSKTFGICLNVKSTVFTHEVDIGWKESDRTRMNPNCLPKHLE